jgi:hypothetical protein
MTRLPGYEVALGFLLATAFWAFLFVFQAGLKNTDWLVVFTAVLAWSTIGLWIATLRTGAKQSRDMQASVAVADRAARAAELSAKLLNYH